MTDLQIQYKVRGIGDESGPDMATHRPCWYLLRDRLRTAIIGNKLRADGADNSPGPPNAKEIWVERRTTPGTRASGEGTSI